MPWGSRHLLSRAIAPSFGTVCAHPWFMRPCCLSEDSAVLCRTAARVGLPLPPTAYCSLLECRPRAIACPPSPPLRLCRSGLHFPEPAKHPVHSRDAAWEPLLPTAPSTLQYHRRG